MQKYKIGIVRGKDRGAQRIVISNLNILKSVSRFVFYLKLKTTLQNKINSINILNKINSINIMKAIGARPKYSSSIV
jgi:hypothetical protein